MQRCYENTGILMPVYLTRTVLLVIVKGVKNVCLVGSPTKDQAFTLSRKGFFLFRFHFEFSESGDY